MTRTAQLVERLRRGAKYGTVGGLGTAVKVAAMVLLHDGCGLGSALAATLAVEISMLHNFAWHTAWTWRDRSRNIGVREMSTRLLRFQLGNGLTALVVNLLTVPLLTGCAGWKIGTAGLAASVLGGVVNFLLSDLWVFARRRAAAA